MAKRTSRVAWTLAAVLAVTVAVGGVVLAAHFQSRLPEEQRTLSLLPMWQWGFSQERYVSVPGMPPPPRDVYYRCGFFAVWIRDR